jgi:hypothetical protein
VNDDERNVLHANAITDAVFELAVPPMLSAIVAVAAIALVAAMWQRRRR